MGVHAPRYRATRRWAGLAYFALLASTPLACENTNAEGETGADEDPGHELPGIGGSCDRFIQGYEGIDSAKVREHLEHNPLKAWDDAELNPDGTFELDDPATGRWTYTRGILGIQIILDKPDEHGSEKFDYIDSGMVHDGEMLVGAAGTESILIREPLRKSHGYSDEPEGRYRALMAKRDTLAEQGEGPREWLGEVVVLEIVLEGKRAEVVWTDCENGLAGDAEEPEDLTEFRWKGDVIEGDAPGEFLIRDDEGERIDIDFRQRSPNHLQIIGQDLELIGWGG